MPQTWKTVRIFISSTFRDMHAERDHLVRFVFPELKEKCRQQRVHLIDVDLRWGVTEADAQDGKALDICLDEIDSCRPYFLGLLGHRYGWIPPGQQYSITAQEIYHGVLHNDIPRQVVDLAKIIDGKLEGRSLSPEQVNGLVGCYRWDADKSKYLLKEDVTEAEFSVIRSVFEHYSAYQRDRSFFFFRSEELSRKLAGTNTEDYFESDPAIQNKLAILKQEIIDAGLSYFEYDEIEAFGEKVGETLWHRIEAELGEVVEEDKDWLEEEAEFHELFAADRTRRFVGRRDTLDRIKAFCEQEGEPSVMVITGEPGCGKSALMGRFSEEIMHAHPDWLIISHFVGASPSSTNLRQTLSRLCSHLSRIIGSPDEVPEDIKELIQVFPKLLATATKQKKVVLILDAVNQFEEADDAHAMRWLPQKLPEYVRFVISTLAGEPFDALLARRPQPEKGEVSGLNRPEIKELVRDYLHEIRREFPNKQVEDAFFHKVKAGNPLYILVALEELRIFGDFEHLPKRIDTLPDDVPDLFDQVLERIESDFNPELVRDCMSYFACGKHGMTAEEMQTLLSVHALLVDSSIFPEKLPDMLWARLYRAFGAYLFERSGVIDFFHGQLKEAVGKRYLKKEADRKTTHKTIADYFDNRWREPYIRAVAELPHQLAKAEDWDGAKRILSNFEFLQAKVEEVGPLLLVEDYKLTFNLGCRPGGLALIQGAVQLSMQVLERDPTQLAAQLLGRLLTNEEPQVWRLLERASAYRSASWLRPCTENLQSPGGPLLLILIGHMLPVTALAIAPEGRLAVSGDADGVLKVWDLDQGIEIHTLIGHETTIDSIAVTPNGRKAVSGARDKTLRVWDLNEGSELYSMVGYKRPLAISTDGRWALSLTPKQNIALWDLEHGVEAAQGKARLGSCSVVAFMSEGRKAATVKSKELIIWDLKQMAVVRTIQISAKTFNTASPDGKYAYAGERDITILDVHQGEEQCKLSGHDWGVHSVVVTPDGRRAFSGSADKTVRVWDLQTRQTLAVLPHPEQVRTVVAKANGSLILSGTQDGTLRLWDVDRAVAATVAEETVGVGSVAVTPNELYAASSHAQRIQVWDLKQKAKLYTLSGHEDEVTSLVATTDSLRVVSGSCDGTIRVWDLERGVEAFRLSGHRGWIKLAVHPNGRIIISAAQDGTVGVWDLDLKKRLCTLDAHEGPIFSLAVTPDGQQAVVGYALWDDFIKIWDLSPLTRHQINGPQPVLEKRSVMLKNSKKTLLSRFKKMSIENHVESGVIGLSVTPGGHRLVAASTNGELHIWDLTRGVKMCILKGHEDRAVTVVVLSDGQRAVSASPDHTIRLWDLDSGDPLVTFTGDSGFTACAVAPQSGTIVAGDSSGRVHFFEDIQVAGIAKPSRSLSPTNRKKLSRTTDTRMRASDRIFEFTYSLLPRIPTIALIGVFIGAGYGVRGGFWKGLLYGCAGGIAAAVAAGLLLLAVWVFLGLPSMLWDRSRGRRWSKWH